MNEQCRSCHSLSVLSRCTNLNIIRRWLATFFLISICVCYFGYSDSLSESMCLETRRLPSKNEYWNVFFLSSTPNLLVKVFLCKVIVSFLFTSLNILGSKPFKWVDDNRKHQCIRLYSFSRKKEIPLTTAKKMQVASVAQFDLRYQ